MAVGGEWAMPVPWNRSEVAILLDESGIGLKEKQLIVCSSSSSALPLTSVHDAKSPAMPQKQRGS